MPAGRLRSTTARRLGRTAALLLVVLALAGCQAKVAVTMKVERDGSGTLAVGVGLDDRALLQLRSLDTDVILSDLAGAGWIVAPAQKEADGMTWLRATKSFANADQLAAAVAEINGPQGLLQGVTFTRTEDGDTTYRLTGTIDTTKGIATFGDPQLAARLGGDGLGGLPQEVEQQEGRPVSDMVSIDVTAQVADGQPTTWHPTLTDTTPTAMDVSLVDPKPPSFLLFLLVVVGLVAAAVVAAVLLTRTRRRFAPTSAG